MTEVSLTSLKSSKVVQLRQFGLAEQYIKPMLTARMR